MAIYRLDWALFARVGQCWLAFGIIASRQGRVGSARVFRYQHFGIGNVKVSHCGGFLTQGPNVRGVCIAVVYRLNKSRTFSRANTNMKNSSEFVVNIFFTISHLPCDNLVKE